MSDDQILPALPLSGRIVTFYSFKGGVGRTMALANTAFIAAMNGKRILVMDWDLEAPGLQYYFRGMQEMAEARALRKAAGILDLVWEWSNAFVEAEAPEDVEAIVDRYYDGAIFDDLVHPLIPDFPGGTGCIHHIGAGGPTIAIPEEVNYEEALSRFDWSAFFVEKAGGVLLEALRDWARARYDYILLDSRTGFADVAGICTMQLPDIVALCFIYNRQNIDGIAQVAGAVRQKNGDNIKLRAVPMRVARENTSEEADARARARKELSRRGGFTVEQIEHDQKQLAIQQASNVPFYETLSFIASDRSRTDVLSLDYLNLASQLLDERFLMPDPYEGWVETVRRRLTARLAAPEYVLDLRSKDSERAREEVTQLLEGAVEDGLDPVGDADYVRALTIAVLHVARTTEDPFDLEPVMTLCLDMLRGLDEARADIWRKPLAEFLTSYIEKLGVVFDDAEELLLLDEADALLAGLDGDPWKLKRLTNRRRAARILLNSENYDSLTLVLQEIGRLVGALRRDQLAPEQLNELRVAEIDTLIVRGAMAQARERDNVARRHYETALAIVPTDEIAARSELAKLHYELHYRLARMPANVLSAERVAMHAMAALDWASSSNALVLHFMDLADAIIRSENPELAARFVIRAFSGLDRRHGQFALFYGRNLRYATRFLNVARRLLDLLAQDGEQGSEAIRLILQTAVATLERASERITPRRLGHQSVGELLQAAQALEANNLVSDDAKSSLLKQLRRLAGPIDENDDNIDDL